MNLGLQESHNEKGMWQSLEFHRTVVSLNIIPFRKIKQIVVELSGCSTGGTKYSSPKIIKNVMAVIQILYQEDGMRKLDGRAHVQDGAGWKHLIQEIQDLFME